MAAAWIALNSARACLTTSLYEEPGRSEHLELYDGSVVHYSEFVGVMRVWTCNEFATAFR